MKLLEAEERERREAQKTADEAAGVQSVDLAAQILAKAKGEFAPLGQPPAPAPAVATAPDPSPAPGKLAGSARTRSGSRTRKTMSSSWFSKSKGRNSTKS